VSGFFGQKARARQSMPRNLQCCQRRESDDAHEEIEIDAI
jgi:hypothetical protein